ncbi:hypothetical protein GDO86_014872 [Hymenochirus boettgeri]|uniref:Uncharacterized protein n=1 Tax=Hymenochirus boettgeri TaxID=247094 RepID=A0A8T2JVL2_9PIPI|nr:hypothetical protein GDO86_014872 [Hymenochirus boettgeri]
MQPDGIGIESWGKELYHVDRHTTKSLTTLIICLKEMNPPSHVPVIYFFLFIYLVKELYCIYRLIQYLCYSSCYKAPLGTWSATFHAQGLLSSGQYNLFFNKLIS